MKTTPAGEKDPIPAAEARDRSGALPRTFLDEIHGTVAVDTGHFGLQGVAAQLFQ